MAAVAGRLELGVALRINLALLQLIAFLMPMRASAGMCITYSGYEVREGRVIFHSRARTGGTSSRVLEELDPATFRSLERPRLFGNCQAGYGADAKTVFYEGKRVDGADAPTFVVLEVGYAKDVSRAYGEGKPLTNLVQTFRVLVESGYATDGKFAYFGSRRLPGENFVSMRIYTKTDKAVFFQGEIVPGVEPARFEEYPAELAVYGHDDHHVVLEGKVIADADPSTFQVIEPWQRVARDSRHVYLHDKPLKQADAASFERIGESRFGTNGRST